MKHLPYFASLWGCALLATHIATAQPYSAGLNDPSNSFDAPVPGFIGPDGEGRPTSSGPRNIVNPIFFGWASAVADYSPAPEVGPGWGDPTVALGPVTGDNFDIVSLGDLSAAEIAAGGQPGSITLTFEAPIRNRTGADFVVYENAFGTATSVFGELAYVEVSSDGIHFARFPSRSLTAVPVPPYGNINPRNVFNLAGKHVNAYGQSWGTPFDLSQVATHPLVIGGQVDLNAITHVRLVDIPGTGDFTDSEGSPIYDAPNTFDSAGFDLHAVGVITRDMNFALWAEKRGLPTH